MKQQEFLDLWQRTDDISNKKVEKYLNEFCLTTEDSEVNRCLDTVELLHSLLNYKEEVKQQLPELIEEPFTVNNAIRLLQRRIVDIYISTLEE